MDEIDEAAGTIRVRAPIHEAGLGTECMSAAPDPVSEDQAILLNTPFWVDSLNYGDVVKLGRPDDIGLRPITEVVVASGHCHVLALTGEHPTAGLYQVLIQDFPDYALRIEGHADSLLCVSVHPDFDPEEVLEVMALWLDEQGAEDDEDVALSPIFETQVGPLEWPGR
jgi:hypothetical protein